MNDKDLTAFFTQGFVTASLNDYTPYDLSIFDTFRFANCLLPEAEWTDPRAIDELNKLQKYFADEWVSLIFDEFELKDNGMWEGVDEGSANWHNDFEDGDAFNSNILLYLDDNTEENGNNIKVRSNGNEGITLYPRRGDFVWLNQKKCFEHRASHETGTRRLLSFEFLIPALM